jgi:uncharacterized protein (DUF488 family)
MGVLSGRGAGDGSIAPGRPTAVKQKGPAEGPRVKKLFTLGYGGRGPVEFVGLLVRAGVRGVVDVRLRPDEASLGAFAKAKTADKGLEKLLADAGMAYRSLPELGNPFLEYADWPDRYRAYFARAGDLLLDRLAGVPEPFCLLCAEKRAADCHRRTIADHLAARAGWAVEHLE